MESFNQKRTNWEGLWYDETSHSYKSTIINLEKLKEFKGGIRIIARKNKYYEKGSNKPNMIFMIADANTVGKETDVKDIAQEMTKGYIKVETTIEIALQGIRDANYGYSYDDLCVEIPSFMYANAEGDE